MEEKGYRILNEDTNEMYERLNAKLNKKECIEEINLLKIEDLINKHENSMKKELEKISKKLDVLFNKLIISNLSRNELEKLYFETIYDN